jgi:hypothetical protein
MAAARGEQRAVHMRWIEQEIREPIDGLGR